MTTIIVPKVIQLGSFELNLNSSETKAARVLVKEVLCIFNEVYMGGEWNKEMIDRITEGIMRSWRLFNMKLELTC